MLFVNFLYALLVSTSLFVIMVGNPIHSILFLIIVFILGSVFLFLCYLEYFARLFVLVYVGAIVVLFLFIIRRLELKIVNSTILFSDTFSFRYLIFIFFLFLILDITFLNYFDISYFIEYHINLMSNSIIYIESRHFVNWSSFVQNTGQLYYLGTILYTEYHLSIIIISILLFVSRVASLALTLQSQNFVDMEYKVWWKKQNVLSQLYN